ISRTPPSAACMVSMREATMSVVPLNSVTSLSALRRSTSSAARSRSAATRSALRPVDSSFCASIIWLCSARMLLFSCRCEARVEMYIGRLSSEIHQLVHHVAHGLDDLGRGVVGLLEHQHLLHLVVDVDALEVGALRAQRVRDRALIGGAVLERGALVVLVADEFGGIAADAGTRGEAGAGAVVDGLVEDAEERAYLRGVAGRARCGGLDAVADAPQAAALVGVDE